MTVIQQLEDEAKEMRQKASALRGPARDDYSNVSSDDWETIDYWEAYADGLDRAVNIILEKSNAGSE